ncbi:MAG: hypothetical protein PGN19_09665 [Pseudomonas oryzihabitans]
MSQPPRLSSALGSILLVAAACYLLVGFSQGFVLSAWSWRTWVVYAVLVSVYPIGLYAGWWKKREPVER